jgi:transposase
MDDSLCQFFFEQSACPAQRQYEALRAVFIDGLSRKDAADRFGYSYDAFRQLVHQFRRDCAADTPPPFSPLTVAVDPPQDSNPR